MQGYAGGAEVSVWGVGGDSVKRAYRWKKKERLILEEL